MKNVISVYKAQSTDEQPVPAGIVHIHLQLDGIELHSKFYEEQAAKIMTVLKGSLPGGTLHALTILMLENKVNLLRVKD